MSGSYGAFRNFGPANLGRAIGSILSLAVISCAMSLQAVGDEPGKAKKGATQKVEFAGFGWGIGIATDFDLRGTRAVDAQVANGVVRVTDSSSNVGISFVLEAHYFIRSHNFGFPWPEACQPGVRNPINCTEIAQGPFVALEIGNGKSAAPKADGPITAFAMGWMVGMRHPAANSNTSWNFGLGMRVNPNGQVLGDGIVANQPLPAGETAIRWKKQPSYGVMLLSSFSFN